MSQGSTTLWRIWVPFSRGVQTIPTILQKMPYQNHPWWDARHLTCLSLSTKDWCHQVTIMLKVLMTFMSQLCSQWDSLSPLAGPGSRLEGGAAPAGAVLCSMQKHNCSRQNAPRTPSSPTVNGAMPIGSKIPRPVQACSSAKSPCPLLFLGEAQQERLSCIVSCVFPPYHKEQACQSIHLQFFCILGGPERGNCSQGSHHQPVPLPKQSKEKPLSLMLSFPHSLAE